MSTLGDFANLTPSFPSISIPDTASLTRQFANIKNPAIELAEANYASQFSEYIHEIIQDYDNKLGSDFEVGLKLVSFGTTVVFAVHDMGYYNPSLIIFNGASADGSPMRLIQHVSQISFLLTSLPRKEEEKGTPKRLIGFGRDEEE